MNKRILAALAAVLLAAPLPARAYTGVGDVSCHAWTASRTQHDVYEPVVSEWVIGFLSGVGFAHGKMGLPSNLSAASTWAWFDRFCAASPTSDLSTAAAMFTAFHSSAETPQ